MYNKTIFLVISMNMCCYCSCSRFFSTYAWVLLHCEMSSQYYRVPLENIPSKNHTPEKNICAGTGHKIIASPALWIWMWVVTLASSDGNKRQCQVVMHVVSAAVISAHATHERCGPSTVAFIALDTRISIYAYSFDQCSVLPSFDIRHSIFNISTL